MGTKYLIGRITDGRRLQTLPVSTGTWSDELDTPESISATVKLGNAEARALDLRNTVTVGKTFLAAIDTGVFGQYGKVLAAGPIWRVTYDRDGESIEITASGMGSICNHRNILPPAARTTPVANWTVLDPSDPNGVARLPNPVVGTYATYSLGGIGIYWLTQMMSWPGGALPLVLPAIEAGTNYRGVEGLDFKAVGSGLDDLTGVINGPEFNFAPRFTSDMLGLEWVVQVGTTAKPLIYQDKITTWNVTAKDSPVESLKIETDGSAMGSQSWAVGGRSSDAALVAHAEDTYLTGLGWPLMEVVDSTHSDVVLQSTLDDYAAAGLLAARTTSEVWSFTVKAHPVDPDGNAAGPQIDDINVGDFISLHFDKYNDKTNRGDLYISAGGDVGLRIIGMSGDEKGIDVLIKCAPRIGS